MTCSTTEGGRNGKPAGAVTASPAATGAGVASPPRASGASADPRFYVRAKSSAGCRAFGDFVAGLPHQLTLVSVKLPGCGLPGIVGLPHLICL